MYDDRMMQMLRLLSDAIQRSDGYALDIRELVSQAASIEAAHDGGARPDPHTLAAGYRVDTRLIPGMHSRVIICDDVLTTGSHYRAMCDVLSTHIDGCSYRGLFLARRAPEAIDFSAFFDEE